MCGHAEGGMREGSSGRWWAVCRWEVKAHCSWVSNSWAFEDGERDEPAE